MSRQALIEEVEDSDDAFSDPSEDDIDDFDDSDILQKKTPSSQAVTVPPVQQLQQLQQQTQRPGVLRQEISGGANQPPPDYGSFPALYPIYFDKARSRAEGRRVSRSLAIDNPLARDIVDACAALRLRTIFEPTKTHPKDWANPGRVKVDLKGASPGAAAIHGKHHLYILVAGFLADHPTTEASAGLRETVRGAPPPPPRDEPYPRPAVPRGWKLPALVPYLSPAMTGGGVSENLFQDVMKEMQGAAGAGGAAGLPDMRQAMAALGGAGGGSASDAKKSKKGKGKA